ncbi:MAG: MFS transporter [Pirellulales bacterium]
MNSLRTKLSFMMFLEFFIWGAWLPLTFTYLPYLKFSPLEQSLILNAFAFGSLVGMFFSNQFVDRNFAAEKFLAVSHLIGGLAIMGLAYVTNFWAFFFLMLIHSLFYVPTISITNAIAFANLKDPQNEFAPVRRMGTIGWIAASIPMIFLLADWTKIPALSEVGIGTWISNVLNTSLTGDAGNRQTAACYVVAGIASLVLAAFSLILPHTPPKKQVEGAPSIGRR